LAYSIFLVLLSDGYFASFGLLRFLQVDANSLGYTGAAVGSVLSMVTGLLLSYRSNQALRKWESGRKVWMVDVRKEVRDGLRMVSAICCM
jgi:predicted membrane chloride channel (bestrophin family)